jgi:hypothetical protein
MFWNGIPNHIRERLPAIVDFILFCMALTMIAAVLLGLTWLYVEYGMALLWLAVGLLFVLHLALQRRGAGHYDPGGSFSGSGPVLPAPRSRQIGKSQRPALPGPKK